MTLPISGVYSSGMRDFRHKKQHNYPSHKLSTNNCALYVLVFPGAQYIKKYTSLESAPYLCTCLAVHPCCSQNRPLGKVLFRYRTFRKQVAIFDPQNGRVGWREPKKAFPNKRIPNTFLPDLNHPSFHTLTAFRPKLYYSIFCQLFHMQSDWIFNSVLNYDPLQLRNKYHLNLQYGAAFARYVVFGNYWKK